MKISWDFRTIYILLFWIYSKWIIQGPGWDFSLDSLNFPSKLIIFFYFANVIRHYSYYPRSLISFAQVYRLSQLLAYTDSIPAIESSVNCPVLYIQMSLCVILCWRQLTFNEVSYCTLNLHIVVGIKPYLWCHSTLLAYYALRHLLFIISMV